MQLQNIQRKIHQIRGLNVMLDFDLAEMYEVETRALKQAVRRNMDRFPDDFMFKLTKDEWKEVITNCDNLPSNARFSPVAPFAFSEQGVAMLSSVLRSRKAVQANIAIMRAFVYVRQYALAYKDLTDRLSYMEQIFDKQFRDVYEAIDYLLEKERKQESQETRRKIGFTSEKPAETKSV
jgi:hypothetical protein